MHNKEIDIKNRVYNYFNILIKPKKLETKNTLGDKKNYEDLKISFIRYHDGKSGHILSLYYNKLMGAIEEY